MWCLRTPPATRLGRPGLEAEVLLVKQQQTTTHSNHVSLRSGVHAHMNTKWFAIFCAQGCTKSLGAWRKGQPAERWLPMTRRTGGRRCAQNCAWPPGSPLWPSPTARSSSGRQALLPCGTHVSLPGDWLSVSRDNSAGQMASLLLCRAAKSGMERRPGCTLRSRSAPLGRTLARRGI